MDQGEAKYGPPQWMRNPQSLTCERDQISQHSRLLKGITGAICFASEANRHSDEALQRRCMVCSESG